MKIFGVEPFKAALEEKLLLAKYFYTQIESVPGIEIACKPDLSIVAFRYLPQNQETERFNLTLIDMIKSDGRIFLSATKLHNRTFIRMACLSYRTHLKHIDLALQIIAENIKILETKT